MDLSTISSIVNFPPPKTIRQIHTTLAHTRYYRKFIKWYSHITVPIEKLLKKDVTFQWNEECLKSLDILKEKMVVAPILVFPYWNKEFHVHVDASCIDLGVVLAQLGAGEIDHPIDFASRKLSKEEKNYTTTKRERLVMVHDLQNFRHYLLWSHFKMFIDHSALKYLVNKHVLGGNIFIWLLLFQEYEFEIIVKLGRLNAGPGHLSRLETREEPTCIEDNLPDGKLFSIRIADDHFTYIIQFFTTGMAPL